MHCAEESPPAGRIVRPHTTPPQLLRSRLRSRLSFFAQGPHHILTAKGLWLVRECSMHANSPSSLRPLMPLIASRLLDD